MVMRCRSDSSKNLVMAVRRLHSNAHRPDIQTHKFYEDISLQQLDRLCAFPASTDEGLSMISNGWKNLLEAGDPPTARTEIYGDSAAPEL